MLVWLMSPMRCGVVVPSSVSKCVQRLVTASSEGPWLAESCGDVETCGDVKTDDGRRVEGGVSAVVEALGEHGVEEHASCAP
jgi:hypothetical protein